VLAELEGVLIFQAPQLFMPVVAAAEHIRDIQGLVQQQQPEEMVVAVLLERVRVQVIAQEVLVFQGQMEQAAVEAVARFTRVAPTMHLVAMVDQGLLLSDLPRILPRSSPDQVVRQVQVAQFQSPKIQVQSLHLRQMKWSHGRSLVLILQHLH
jgi:hypothetical protein